MQIERRTPAESPNIVTLEGGDSIESSVKKLTVIIIILLQLRERGIA